MLILPLPTENFVARFLPCLATKKMQENKDPSIKLFGQKISFPSDTVPISVKHFSSQATTQSDDEEESEQCPVSEKATVTEQDDAIPDFDTEDLTTVESMPETNVNEETEKLKVSKIEKEQSDSPNLQEKTLKKPDKIVPCPRCNSMDTKFCYYNNYNVSQPRHFCKACQRYWTAGGTMRNVPVGAGRRKNKNSASHYRHITISEAFQAAARIDSPIETHHQTLKSNGRVIGFSVDAPVCDSVASAIKLTEQKVLNGTQKGFHNIQEQGIRVRNQGVENGDDCSSGSTVTVSTNSIEEGGKTCIQESLIRNVNGFPSQIPCLSGVPWPYAWSAAVPPPAFCSSGFPMSFYPASYWNCGIPGTWSMPLLPPQASSPNQKNSRSGSNSTTLGKHSRDVEMLKSDITEDEQPSKQKSRHILVPKTLRIDDPSEAAKSSIWTTLGIRNELSSGGGLYKAFQTEGDQKKHTSETSRVLQANPAALCRSSNFHETT